jgi:hypothetical protein
MLDLVSFDDSSDEESSNLNSPFDDLDQLKQNLNAENQIKDLFNLLSYDLGLKTFYSQSVQDEYYKLKKDNLSYENVLTRERIKLWLKECCEKTLTGYFRLPKNNNSLTKYIIQNFKTKYEAELSQWLDNIIDQGEISKQSTKIDVDSELGILVREYIKSNYFKTIWKKAPVKPIAAAEWTLDNFVRKDSQRNDLKSYIIIYG